MKKMTSSQALSATISCRGMVLVSRKLNTFSTFGVFLQPRYQANALAAYWACQGWGNNPDDYDDDFKSTISDFLTSKSASNGQKFEDTLLNTYWGYTVVGYPALVVLDTRTQRVFKNNYPQLMSSQRIKKVGQEFRRINENYTDNSQQSVLLMSAAPFLGFKLLERLQLKAKGLSEYVDVEPWIGSEIAYNNLRNELQRIKFDHCCILSGDVHYAFVRQLQLPRDTDSDLIVTQLVSSSLHNSPNGIINLLLKKLSQVEKHIFNRINSPYLFPEGHHKNDDCLSGLVNVDLLQLENGKPVKNTFVFCENDSSNTFEWNYDLNNPNKVNFN